MWRKRKFVVCSAISNWLSRVHSHLTHDYCIVLLLRCNTKRDVFIMIKIFSQSFLIKMHLEQTINRLCVSIIICFMIMSLCEHHVPTPTSQEQWRMSHEWTHTNSKCIIDTAFWMVTVTERVSWTHCCQL